MLENVVFVVVELIVFIISMLVLFFGIFFLVRHSKHISRNQNLYLISLTISEVILNSYHLYLKGVAMNYQIYRQKPFVAIEIFYYNTVWLVNLLTLLFLTLDRFAEVYLNIKYKIYITQRKTLFVISWMWITGLAAGVISILVERFGLLNPLKFSFTYIWPVLDSIILLNAIAVYLYIYKKLKECSHTDKTKVLNVSHQSYSNNADDDDVRRKKGHPRNRFRKRKFFIPVFIMISFFFFIYIPDMTSFVTTNFFNMKTDVDTMKRIFMIMYSMNMISDVMIYIIMQRGIRAIIVKKWETRCRNIK